MRAAALLVALALLSACHARGVFPLVSCPPPRVVEHVRIIHAPAPALPLTRAERDKAEHRAARLRRETDRLDAQVRALLKAQSH